nr:MAG TPA: hypothetical protein [Caudoviricetes sp.]
MLHQIKKASPAVFLIFVINGKSDFHFDGSVRLILCIRKIRSQRIDEGRTFLRGNRHGRIPRIHCHRLFARWLLGGILTHGFPQEFCQIFHRFNQCHLFLIQPPADLMKKTLVQHFLCFRDKLIQCFLIPHHARHRRSKRRCQRVPGLLPSMHRAGISASESIKKETAHGLQLTIPQHPHTNRSPLSPTQRKFC